ncbi:ImuA family protein [Pseudoroseomonas cervicalis]|uniref:ImuA family protein n=1 Tax=Teichococcus cervicalis TaxID=204525 RepID=UPI0022F19CCD|nr:hypothetical protein [Pseudoroseomonas cervicalis]WBV44818.1 hypothetical protein PFY06_18805 [Pseudoroseomonas cervicalis]
MPASPDQLAALRHRLARIERGLGEAPPPPLRLAPAIDRHLPEGGLARGALHEVTAADPGAALGFCALLLGRAGGTVLWIAPRPDALWPPGLRPLGLPVERLVLARYRQPQDGLWALEEALRSPALAGALLQIPSLPMLAARRLQLAAEAGGGIGLLLRDAAEADPDSPAPGGAANALTRWHIASEPGGGTPCWRLRLLRCRGGRPAAWRVAAGPEGLRVTQAAPDLPAPLPPAWSAPLPTTRAALLAAGP